MALFDVNDLMNQSTEGEMETSLPPIPEGEWAGYITKVEGRVVNTKNGETPVLDVTWVVTDQSVIDSVGIATPQVRQTIWLDIDASGRLALGTGKNLGLGRLREAVGQNGPKPWNFAMLEGQQAIIKISHREYNDQIYADVKGVAKA